MKILPLRYSALMRRPTSPISAAVEKNKIRFDSSKADVSRSLNMLASSELLDYLVDMPIPLQLQWKGDAQVRNFCRNADVAFLFCREP